MDPVQYEPMRNLLKKENNPLSGVETKGSENGIKLRNYHYLALRVSADEAGGQGGYRDRCDRMNRFS
jgi:hypothetical protein